MAIIVWNGATGDFNLGTNWVGGTAPGASDDAVFNDTSVQDVDTDVDTIAAMTGLRIMRGYTGNIGGSGNEVDCSVDKLEHYGSGELWFKDAAGLTDNAIIQTVNPSTVVNLGGSTITNMTLKRGTITLASDMGAITLLNVGFVANRSTDATVTITAGAGTTTTYNQTGGNVTAANTITTANVWDGILNKTSTTSITSLHMHGGVCNYKSDGDITNLYGHGGLLDIRPDAQTDGTTITITNAYLFPGFQIRYDPALVTLGGTILMDARSQ